MLQIALLIGILAVLASCLARTQHPRVSANEFALVDSSGQLRASLTFGISQNEPGLYFYDDDGNIPLHLNGYPEGPSISFKDKLGRHIMLDLHEEFGPALQISGSSADTPQHSLLLGLDSCGVPILSFYKEEELARGGAKAVAWKTPYGDGPTLALNPDCPTP